MNATEIDCRSINDLYGGYNKCSFLVENDVCRSSDSVVDYMYLAFCTIDSTHYYGPIAAATVLFLVLFISLGVTADDFLCPSLLVISKTLHLSQNIAGVTLLAFGNGSPDIFSSLAGIQQTRPELVIGELFGAGIFVTTVVVGSIFMCKSFTSMRRPILRDMCFYLFAAYMAWATVFHGSISFFHALAFILFYVFYLVVVIMGRFVNQRLKKRKENEQKRLEKAGKSTNGFQYSQAYETNKSNLATRSFAANIETNNNHIADRHLDHSTLKSVLISEVVDNRFGIDNPALDIKETISPSGRRFSHSVHHHFDNTIFHLTHSLNEGDDLACTNPECECAHQQRTNAIGANYGSMANKTNLSNARQTNASMASVLTSESNQSLPNFDSQSISSSISSFANLQDLNEFQEFLVHICPLDYGEWKSSSLPSKAYQILKAPIYFCLLITIPVIDYENERDNWCRILNSIHLITAPLTILYVTGMYERVIESWYFIAIVTTISVLSALAVFFATSNKQSPRFHYLYGFLGFVVSMLWIYALATETISLLHVIGIMLNLSDFILGLTVLAFGNSVGDLMSNISMTKNGFGRMGLSACFGGPMFNLLFGIGLPYCLVLYKDPSVHLTINYSKMVTLSFGTVSTGLLATMFMLIFSDFATRRWHGLVLFMIYLFYVTTACLIELKYI